ncbi:MAG: hypothetical protein FJ098_00555, partial [Deltaproteobacteria bacterium]|nr:hypothetical protein [Deltaproteobacteria bacterium]
AVEAARKAVSLELVAWVSFAARLRGHITAADHLVDLADWLLGRREETWAGVFPSDDGAPPFLRRLPGLPALGPWVRRWHVAPNPSERAALVEELLRVKALHGFLPRWGLTLVRELLRREEALAASTAPRPLSAPPRDPLATAVVGAWRWLVSMTPDTFDQAAFLDRLDALAAAGLAREVLGAVAYALSILQSGGRTASEPLLLALASDRIPAAIFPVDRALALNELGAALMRAPDLLPAILAYEEIVPVLTARIPEREELENRLRRVNLLGSAGQLPALEEAVDSLLPMLERRYGRTGEVTWSLLSVEVALRVFGRSADSPPEETLSLLASLGDSVNGAFPARQFFRLLAAAPPGEPREALAGAYLHFMFQNGPPLQEPAPAPGSGPPPPPRG